MAWPPRWPLQVCGVAGSSPWLVGLPRAVAGFVRFLVPLRAGLVGGGQHLFMGMGCRYDMMKPILLGNGSRKVARDHPRNCVGELVLSKRVWTLSTLMSALSTWR